MIGEFVIPEPTLRAVRDAPAEAATLLLIRHSARGPIPQGDPGNDVLLLPEGKLLASALGREVGGRLRTLHASPVRRCVETAESLKEGSGVELSIAEDRRLGHPGVYVEGGVDAWTTWQTLGHEGVLAKLIAGEQLLGLTDPLPASRRLVAYMLATAAGVPGIHAFVTHDSLVTVAAAHCLGLQLGRPDWPWYLEALAIVVTPDRPTTASYRGWTGVLPWV